MRCVGQLARRAAKRSLANYANYQTVSDAEAAARSVLTDCGRLDDLPGLSALSDNWCRLFDIVTARTTTDDAAYRRCTSELRALIGRIWQHAVVGSTGASMSPAEETSERLFMDTDQAIRQTYRLAPDDGLVVRRAFLGVATSAVELSGLNPYSRMTDGVATLCGLWQTLVHTDNSTSQEPS